MRSLKYQELYERLFDQYSEKDAPQHFYSSVGHMGSGSAEVRIKVI